MILTNRFCYSAEFLRRCEARLFEAFDRVPLYMEWGERGLKPDGSAPLDERFDALPALRGADLRAGPALERGRMPLMPMDRQLKDGLESGAIALRVDPGPEGETAHVVDRDWQERSRAAGWALSGLNGDGRRAVLAGARSAGLASQEDLPLEGRLLGGVLHLNEKPSTAQWTPRLLRRMARELNDFRPAVLEADPAFLARLAWWAADADVLLTSPGAVVLVHELPAPFYLDAIRRVFDCPVFSAYGSLEAGLVMMQGRDELLHQNAEFCRIDFQPLKEPFGGPELGRAFVTTFGSPWTCVLRLDMGDLLRLCPRGGSGEGMVAEAVEGRLDDVTFTLGGRLVTTGTLDARLALIPRLRDYRLEQTGRDAYRIRALFAPGDVRGARGAVHDALQDVYGGRGRFEIELAQDEVLPPLLCRGKFRRTQTALPFDAEGMFLPLLSR